jgi:hypothetical protein
MQAIENWSRVTGRVVSWAPPAGDDQPGELVIDVERVEPVAREGGRTWPNRLEQAAGQRLRVRIPPSAAATLKARAGDAVSVNVRRGRDASVVFANPEAIDLRSRR